MLASCHCAAAQKSTSYKNNFFVLSLSVSVNIVPCEDVFACMKQKANLTSVAFTDFKPDSLLRAVEEIAKGSEQNGASAMVTAMETLCTTIVVDQNDWASNWCKLFQYVMDHEFKLPSALKTLGLSVPRKYVYMLDAPGLKFAGAKTEVLEEEQGEEIAAKDAGASL